LAFFFFAMTLSMSPLTVKEQWLQRHECHMNGLWRKQRPGYSPKTRRRGPRRRAPPGDVRYWHLADITTVLIHVRFFGGLKRIYSRKGSLLIWRARSYYCLSETHGIQHDD